MSAAFTEFRRADARGRGEWSRVEGWQRGLACLLLATVSSGCTADYYRQSAEREAGGILRWKAQDVPNVDGAVDLDITTPEALSLDDLKKNTAPAEFLGDAADAELGGRVIPLDEALRLAITYNRGYRSQKELVYLLTLDLTLARHELTPLFTGGGSVVRASNDTGGARRDTPDVDAMAGAVETNVDRIVADNTFAASGNLGFTSLQRTGARLAADFTTDFLRFLGGGRSINESELVVSLVQPLLRGAGYKVTLETLTQAERDVLYAIRDFATFRREFVVGIAERYYNALQARDQVRNNWLGYQGFLESLAREGRLAEEDRSTQSELGQLNQAALKAESAWVDSVVDYQRQLDELKIELGISVGTPIVLKQEELAELEIIDPKVGYEQAVDVALSTRPDLWSAVDRVEDAERRIEVARNDLQAGLDVVADYQVIGGDSDGLPSLDFDRNSWSAGLQVDLPFDRKEERNNYRAALISLEQSRRDRELAEDQVRLQINNGWRSLSQAKRNYEINRSGVDLAERRLRHQILLAENGDGDARDLIEARQELINAQNAVTSSLVDHTLARLRLWQNMGILYITDSGSWKRVLEEEADAHE